MSARDVVTARIAAQTRRYPELDLTPMELGGLEQRDAALAAAIEHAVVRRWLTLAAVLESQLSRPWHELEAKLQAVLLTGAAQLLLLDRLPDHAVINEAVEWAKHNIRAKAGGLVNAVLRKVAGLRLEKNLPEKYFPSPISRPISRDELPLHDGHVWKLAQPIFAESFATRLAQQTSHPDTLITHWLAMFGQEKTTALALHNLIHAPIIVHGTNESHLQSTTALQITPHQEPGFFVVSGDHDALTQLLQSNPNAIVQDPTSAAPATAIARLDPPPKTIIDVCAGKGTKTRQLALHFPEARIIATDIDDNRLTTLREAFAGSQHVQVIEHRRLAEFTGQPDLLLLDVPCSNTGVLARRVEAKYRFSTQSLAELVSLQKQIIADSIGLLAPNGRIVYSTCSIEPAENQQQVQWISKWHPFQIVQSPGAARLPSGLPGEPACTYADGGFFAILQR